MRSHVACLGLIAGLGFFGCAGGGNGAEADAGAAPAKTLESLTHSPRFAGAFTGAALAGLTRTLVDPRERLAASLPSRATDALHLADAKRPDVWADVHALDVGAVPARVDGGVVTYPGALADGDLVLASSLERIEEFRVHAAKTDTIVARWRITPSAAIERVRAREGRIELVEANGRAALQTAPLVAVDADDRELPIELSIARDGGAWIATARVDARSARFPVVVDPAWSVVAPMSIQRRQHLSATLSTGNVLVVGGARTAPVWSGELYDPVKNTWTTVATPAGNPNNSRTTLHPTSDGGAVLADFGDGPTPPPGCTDWSGGNSATVQRWNPTTSAWSDLGNVPAGGLPKDPENVFHSTGDGRIFVAGSVNSCGLPGKGTAVAVLDPITAKWSRSTMQMLLDSRLSVAQGPSFLILAIAGGSVLSPDLKTWTPVSVPSFTSGATQWMGQLSSGRVIAAAAQPTGIELAVLPPGSPTWGTKVACGNVLIPKSNSTWMFAATVSDSFVETTASTFSTLSPTGCTTIDYATSKIWMRDGTVAALNDGRTMYSGGTLMGAPTNQVLLSGGGLNGTACTDITQCDSGNCVEGVCCDKPCGTTCNSCRGTKNGLRDGVCAPSVAGLHETGCIDEYTTTTGAPRCAKGDGTCDGKGACRTVASAGLPCGVTNCASTTSTSGASCDGGGVCQSGTISCAPYVCDATAKSCKTKCVANEDCAGDSYCTTDGVCVARKENGTACGADRECKGTICVDGVCCNAPCTGQCEACDVSGHEGSCWPVDGAPHAPRVACAGAGSAACGGACKGSIDRAQCTYPTTATDCGSACSDGTFTEKKCDGKGACAPRDSVACGAYACSDVAPRCRDACAKDGDCAMGYICSDQGKCIPEPGPKCSDDGLSSLPPRGASTACGAYRCDSSTGLCRQTCGSSDQCAAGFVCGVATRTCEAQPAANTEDGGGCAMSSRGTRTDWGVVASVLVALGLARRRRRD